LRDKVEVERDGAVDDDDEEEEEEEDVAEETARVNMGGGCEGNCESEYVE
jgi:hypothetical protein